MLSIFICEDELDYLNSIKKSIENYISMEELAMAVVCASTTPNEIIDYLKSNEGVAGLYFLDLNLGCDINGIELAEYIREYDPRGFIVFITSDGHSHRLTFEYRIEAMDYIVKGDLNLKERINECIRNAHAKLTAKATPLQDNFTFKLSTESRGKTDTFRLAKDSVVSIPSSQIMYFILSEHIKHTVRLYTTCNSFYEFRGNLSQIEREIDKKRFYRCERNIIVSLENIKAVDIVQLKIIFQNDLLVDIEPRPANKLAKRVRGYLKELQQK